MQLNELFNNLTYGELSQVALGGKEFGEVDPCRYKELATHINLGLTELHTRFPLKKKVCSLTHYDSISKYYIHDDFSSENVESGEPVKYLTGYTGNILKIEEVIQTLKSGAKVRYEVDQIEGSDLILNPEFNELVFKPELFDDEEVVEVRYRQDHDPIVCDENTDPTTVEIDIPPSFVEPLLQYIAARVLTPMRSSLDQVPMGTEYMSKFELTCQNRRQYGTINRDEEINTKLESRGWV